MSENELNEYLEFAKKLALEAGEIMRRYFMASDIGHQWKDDNTPLTVADTKINSLVIKAVNEKYPLHGVLGEEESYKSNDSLLWVLDPIDGTVPFSLGMPLSTFCLALVDKTDGKPVVAVIYEPFLKSLYSAVKGGGAFLNEAPIKTSDNNSLERTYVSVLGSIPRDKTIYVQPGKCIDILRDEGANVMSLISQLYVAAKVASGEFSGSIFGYGSPWDSACGYLLVTEAGGVVTDLEGNDRRYDQIGLGCVLSANQLVHSKLIEAVQKARP